MLFNDKRSWKPDLVKDTPEFWVLSSNYTELNIHFRFVWETYIKYFTVFLTFNVAALALTIRFITLEQRLLIVVIFAILNLITAVTGARVAEYSRSTSKRIEGVVDAILSLSGTRAEDKGAALTKATSPAPGTLAYYAGYANCVANIALAGGWVATLNIPKVVSSLGI